MGKITKAILLTCISIVAINSHAQNEIKLDVPRIVPISPTASAMEKHQSYPVDYCTGIPNITIPLYEIMAGEVIIPVTLTYHASGIKPKERSGSAGTGWTLNLEPSVTRQINGVADDAVYGWFNRNNTGNSVPLGEAARLKYYGEMVDNIRDTSPDKITYKLPNGGGSGYFYERFQPLLTIPRNNDKVEYAGDINITDENGIKYVFNGAKEKTGDYITRWMCASIWSPRNTTSALVSFEYRTASNLINPNNFYNLTDKLIFNEERLSGDPITTLTEQMPYEMKYYQISKNMGSSEAKLTEILNSEGKVNYPKIDQYTTGYISAAWLQKVNFLGNKLSVNYKSIGNTSHNSNIIDEIIVEDEKGKIVRSIKFYAYPQFPRPYL